MTSIFDQMYEQMIKETMKKIFPAEDLPPVISQRADDLPPKGGLIHIYLADYIPAGADLQSVPTNSL
jgi:hypothetical protein